MHRILFWVCLVLAVTSSVLWFVVLAGAHDHKPGESAEEQRTIEFLRNWRRPKGPYNIVHRQGSCCYISGQQQDCFPVKAIRMNGTNKEVLPDTEGTIAGPGYNHWYVVPPEVEEANQVDPKESPDARAYVCVTGNMVVCYTEGAGL
jgi:hypothetical protein